MSRVYTQLLVREWPPPARGWAVQSGNLVFATWLPTPRLSLVRTRTLTVALQAHLAIWALSTCAPSTEGTQFTWSDCVEDLGQETRET